MKTKPIHFWVLVDRQFGDLAITEFPSDIHVAWGPQAYFTRREARIAAKHNLGMFRVTKVKVK